MKKTKELHQVWVEWNTIPAEMKEHMHMKKSLIGKWHYHYENKNGVIGLIRIQVPRFTMKPFKKNNPLVLYTHYMWEACGILEFRRFPTKKDAEVAIYNALKEKQ